MFDEFKQICLRTCVLAFYVHEHIDNLCQDLANKKCPNLYRLEDRCYCSLNETVWSGLLVSYRASKVFYSRWFYCSGNSCVGVRARTYANKDMCKQKFKTKDYMQWYIHVWICHCKFQSIYVIHVVSLRNHRTSNLSAKIS